jgi:hypothetical protein
MKRVSFVLFIMAICVQVSCSLSPQATSNSANSSSAASSTAGQPPEAARLQRFKGEWMLGTTYQSRPAVAVTSGVVNVAQPTPDSVSFKSSLQLGSGPYATQAEELVVTLRYDAARKQYFLDAKLANGMTIKDMPMTYSDADGYAGKGTARGSAGGEMSAEATVKNEKEKEHKWNIMLSDNSRKEEYTFSFSSKTDEK